MHPRLAGFSLVAGAVLFWLCWTLIGIPARTVGLAFLAMIALAQSWVGVSVARLSPR